MSHKTPKIIEEVQSELYEAIKVGYIKLDDLYLLRIKINNSIHNMSSSDVITYLLLKQGYKLKLAETCFELVPKDQDVTHGRCSIFTDRNYSTDSMTLGKRTFVPLFSLGLGFDDIMVSSIYCNEFKIEGNVYRNETTIDSLVKQFSEIPKGFSFTFPVLMLDGHTVNVEPIIVRRTRFNYMIDKYLYKKLSAFTLEGEGNMETTNIPVSLLNVSNSFVESKYKEFTDYISEMRNCYNTNSRLLCAITSIVISQRKEESDLGSDLYYTLGYV